MTFYLFPGPKHVTNISKGILLDDSGYPLVFSENSLLTEKLSHNLNLQNILRAHKCMTLMDTTQYTKKPRTYIPVTSQGLQDQLY